MELLTEYLSWDKITTFLTKYISWNELVNRPPTGEEPMFYAFGLTILVIVGVMILCSIKEIKEI